MTSRKGDPQNVTLPGHPSAPHSSGRPGTNSGDSDEAGHIKDGVKTPAPLAHEGKDRKLPGPH